MENKLTWYRITDGITDHTTDSWSEVIDVKFESTSLETVLAHRDETDESIVGYRWERFWGIEYLVEEGDNATHA